MLILATLEMLTIIMPLVFMLVSVLVPINKIANTDSDADTMPITTHSSYGQYP